MAPLRSVGLALLLTALTAAAAGASPVEEAENAATAPLLSIETVARIVRQLARPVVLQIVVPQQPPTFRVEIHQHLYWKDEPPLLSQLKVPPMTPLVAPRFSPGQPAADGAAGGGVGFDPYAAIGAVRHAFQQRAAEKEVREVVAELCAVTTCTPN